MAKLIGPKNTKYTFLNPRHLYRKIFFNYRLTVQGVEISLHLKSNFSTNNQYTLCMKKTLINMKFFLTQKPFKPDSNNLC